MTRLRGFQTAIKHQIYAEWQAGNKVVMPVLPTGAGKTVLMADIAHEYAGYGFAIAHRSELVGQISVALAREQVRHDIIAPKGTVRDIVTAHMQEIGRSYYDARAKWSVASVDTLLRRDIPKQRLQQVGMVFQDEGHHVLRDNKWGRANALFPNAYGLLPSASPERADGRGLGRHADGIVDALVVGPNMRWMIDNGYLTDYVVRAPQTSDLDMTGVEISTATGDYNQDQMRTRVKRSNRIVGDVVATYKKWAYGKLGITFAVDVEHATDIAAEYNRQGIPAVVVSADTPEGERRDYMRKFKAREIWQLVNVDLFGEGVDVPALECVSMARPTASYGLYVQQFGRALRLMISEMLSAAWDMYTPEQRKQHIAESGKPFAQIFDHVGNLITHKGPPDWRTQPWTLDARERRTRATDGIPTRVCGNETCMQPFQRIFPSCPYCNWVPPEPADRSKPEFVDGDLVLYDRELLEKLFGEKKKVDGPCYVPMDATPIVKASIRKMHAARQEAQAGLRQAMALVMPPTRDERINQRKFYLTYGIDTLGAQALGSKDADELRQRILGSIK